MSSRPISDASFQATGLLRQAGYQQANRLLALHTPLGENKLLAERLVGTESVDDGGFSWVLTALSDDAHVSLKSLIGKAVRVDLQTADGQPRAIHGHVTAFDLLASNGGFARYRLRIEPWLAFLRWRQDSYVFQDKSAIDIVDELLGDYQGAGSLAPVWRWELADRGVYPRRGITTQYRESDLAFVMRLLAEEGLYYWFEHEGGGSTDGEGSLGRHTLVIADHAGAWQPNRQARVAFHRADATEQADTLQGWQARRTLQTNQLKRHSWDYKSVATRPVELASQHDNSPQRIALEWADDPGNYAWEDRAQGERLLGNAMQALEVRNKQFDGESTVRTMAPATIFTLDGHFVHEQDSEDDRRFAVLSVHHEARNNFDEDLQRAVNEALGAADGVGVKANANAEAEVPFYRNRFTAVRARIPYRPASRDAHGVRLHPKPTVHGSQSALVIGTDEESAVHTDRDHRVKVQFHWQRGGRSSSRLSHPGGDNATANDQLGAWLRVASATAGDNWGQVSLPRVGQEVLVEYLHGDIDRPVVVAALSNGAGEPDAQTNQKQTGAASATGNAPAWFAGQTGEHAHNAVFSGIKTQEMDRSQQGTGGYNQLVFDDTAGQPRLGLATTQATSRLNLGHHTQQDDNRRGKGRGHGAELATAAHGAVRGGAGLLISADAQLDGKGAFLDSAPAQAETAQAGELARKLAESAQHQGAKLAGEPAPDKLPAIEALKTSAEILAATQDVAAAQNAGATGAAEVRTTEGGTGTVNAYSEAQLQFSAPKGIGMMTPAEAVLVSGATSSIVATQDVNVVAQGQLSIGVAQGLSLYTMGTAAPAGDPNQERGIRLHAATGAVKAQSQAGPTKLAAQRDVTVSSTSQDVKLDGKQHVLLTSAGAYVRLEGSSIQIHAPGAVTFRASAHRFVGPQGAATTGALASSTLKGCATQVAGAAMAGAAFLRLGDTRATPAAADLAPGRRLAAEGAQERWEIKDVLAKLCPDDKAVVDKLATQDVTLADALYFEDPYYDGAQWTTKRFDAGGILDGEGGITLVTDVSPETAATTLYHEMWHAGQPKDMSWMDAEIDAYTRTEAWTIAKGFAGQDGDALRVLDAAGKAVPSKDAIVAKVKEAYPIAIEPPKVATAAVGALPGAAATTGPLAPVTVVGRNAKGLTLLSDGTARAPVKGDTYAGPEIKVGERKVPRDVWKCPDESKETPSDD